MTAKGPAPTRLPWGRCIVTDPSALRIRLMTLADIDRVDVTEEWDHTSGERCSVTSRLR